MRIISFIIILAFFLSCEKNSTTPNDETDTLTTTFDTIWLGYQDYIPFPESHVQWKTHSGTNIWLNGQVDPMQPPDQQIDYFNTYYFLGDTLMNGMNYLRIMREYDFFQTNYETDDTLDFGTKDEIFGFFRQDLMQKKVFIIYSGYTEEQLLYDFSLEPREILENDEYMYGTMPCYIECIDSIRLFDRYHKVQSYAVDCESGNCRSIGVATVIEGIGDIKSGPFTRSDYFQELWYNEELVQLPNQAYNPPCYDDSLE